MSERRAGLSCTKRATDRISCEGNECEGTESNECTGWARESSSAGGRPGGVERTGEERTNPRDGQDEARLASSYREDRQRRAMLPGLGEAPNTREPGPLGDCPHRMKASRGREWGDIAMHSSVRGRTGQWEMMGPEGRRWDTERTVLERCE